MKLKIILAKGQILTIIIFSFLILSQESFADLQSCEKNIFNEFEKITLESRQSFFQNLNNNEINWEEKKDISTYNYRAYKCAMSQVCKQLSFVILGANGTGSALESIQSSIIGCPGFSIDSNAFNSCKSNKIKDIQDILNKCKEEEIRISKIEKERIIKDFKINSEVKESNFLSARLLSLNNKMRGFLENMQDLKSNFNKIFNNVFCKQR